MNYATKRPADLVVTTTAEETLTARRTDDPECPWDLVSTWWPTYAEGEAVEAVIGCFETLDELREGATDYLLQVGAYSPKQ
jgi:hypothetical protein